MKKDAWQAAYGEAPASFDARIQQTLNHLEEEKKVKKISFRVAVIVIVLLLSLTGVAYAASQGWMIGDYYNNNFGDNVNAPEGFASGFDQNLTQQVGDIVFTVRDAYMDTDIPIMIVSLSRADGKPAVFLSLDETEDSPIGDLIRGNSQEDERTIAQYARDIGAEMYSVSFGISQPGKGYMGGSSDEWIEEDGSTALFFASDESAAIENGAATLEWHVLLLDGQGGRQESTMEISLPADEMIAWEVPVNQSLDGLPVILDQLSLKEGRMGLHVDFTYHLDTENKDPEARKLVEAIQQGYTNLWFRIIDPETGMELPGGASIGGSSSSPDDIHFTQTGDTLTTDFEGDTLYIQAFDAWEKERYGTIAVKIK